MWPLTRAGLGLTAGFLALALAPLSASAEPDPPAPVPDAAPLTVVTLTFDDGWRNQADAAEVLWENRMRGTFFINSGMWTYPDYMSRNQVLTLVAEGHEIGGHTLTHPHLDQSSMATRKREICKDRTNLQALGTSVRSFAYPYGFSDAALRSTVESCGYTSARRASGLADRSPKDPLCDCIARLPFRADRWDVEVKPTVKTADGVAKLKSWVLQAEQVGGWVPIVFHRICDACGPESTTLADFREFVQWLAQRPDETRVLTYGEVVNAGTTGPPRLDEMLAQPYQPLLDWAPAARVSVPAPDAALSRGGDYAFSVDGQGIGQLQVVILFVSTAIVAVTGFRVVTRRRRFL